MANFSQVIWTWGLVYSSLHLIQSQAYVFNSVHGIFILLISVFMGVVPSKGEFIGVACIILGIVIMLCDAKAERVGADPDENTLIPTLIDLSTSFCGALYFLATASNAKRIPMCLLLVIMSMNCFFLSGFIAKLQTGGEI
jgi:drug/metabolite transporter (DMT)-like permease